MPYILNPAGLVGKAGKFIKVNSTEDGYDISDSPSVQPLVYRALLSQTGTSAPTAIVVENTLGGTVVWSRTGAGQYLGTLTGAFTNNKTFIFSSPVVDFSHKHAIGRNDVNSVFVATAAFGVGTANEDDRMGQIGIEILVYP